MLHQAISAAYNGFAAAGYEAEIEIIRRAAGGYDASIADYAPIMHNRLTATAVIKRGPVAHMNKAGGFEAQQGVLGYAPCPIYTADEADNGEADILRYDGTLWLVSRAERQGGFTRFEAVRAPIDVSVNL